MGLNESYSAIRGQILLMNPLPSVRQAYSSISQEEKQRLLSSMHTGGDDSSGNAAMAVHNSNNRSTEHLSAGFRRSERFDNSYGPQGFRSQEKPTGNFSGGRRFQQDRRRPTFGRGRPYCTHCEEAGHWVQTCY